MTHSKNADSNEELVSYPEFANLLRDCHAGKAATYTATDTNQKLYNQQAVDALVRQKEIEAYQRGRIDEAKICEKAKRHQIKRRTLMEFYEKLLATVKDQEKLRYILGTIATNCDDDTVRAYLLLARQRLTDLLEEKR